MSDKENKGNEDAVDIELEENHDDNSPVDVIEKIKKLKKELAEVKKEKMNLLTELQRAKADFINMRKRDEEHLKEMVKFAGNNVISDLIPTLDSFDMAFSNKEAWEKAPKEWRVGVEYIFNQLMSALESNGIVVINPIGQDFNTAFHEAVENVHTEKEKDGKIIEVVQKGYKLADRLIRPAKVKVGIAK